ncbi:MAG TPA: hypothetical protein VIL39_09275 [Verrucomicrobiae bacterium]
MIYLLDVNVLLAAIIQNHPNHAVTDAWLRNKLPFTALKRRGREN